MLNNYRKQNSDHIRYIGSQANIKKINVNHLEALMRKSRHKNRNLPTN